MCALPSSEVLRPGEEKNIESQIKGNTNLQSEAGLTADINSTKDIKIDFIPNKRSIPASGAGFPEKQWNKDATCLLQMG
jgi:hypothetical protein